ncbi:MAG: Putative periplasmic protein [uncultured Sulfurovum sp.]|uniref:Periplasmic protein n=1 Tax=uncultured Sulfurovum sp. TaxID=269237 RepID=A0A6S6S4Z3_9BACT|nr:MAG: Putative periplasmic protein [uncultured Sulfurovum sp.]
MSNNITFSKKIIMLSLLLLSPLFAIQEANIKSEMENKINYITTILQNKNLSSTEKKGQISPTTDSIFDYTTMSKISLGKKWKQLTVEERENFSQKFKTKLKNSYFEKLELYTNEKVLVKELKKLKATRIQLYTEIVAAEENYEIIYKFYKVKASNDWLIYDIDITGVSIIQTYRKQFSEFLATKSFNELLNSL